MAEMPATVDQVSQCYTYPRTSAIPYSPNYDMWDLAKDDYKLSIDKHDSTSQYRTNVIIASLLLHCLVTILKLRGDKSILGQHGLDEERCEVIGTVLQIRD